VIFGLQPTLQHLKRKSIRDQENTIIFKIWDKKGGLKNSPKRNNVIPQYVKTGNEDINDSEDINP
jgi:hypothetical protein